MIHEYNKQTRDKVKNAKEEKDIKKRFDMIS